MKTHGSRSSQQYCSYAVYTCISTFQICEHIRFMQNFIIPIKMRVYPVHSCRWAGLENVIASMALGGSWLTPPDQRVRRVYCKPFTRRTPTPKCDRISPWPNTVISQPCDISSDARHCLLGVGVNGATKIWRPHAIIARITSLRTTNPC